MEWAMYQINMSSFTWPSLPGSHYVNFSLKSGAPELNFHSTKSTIFRSSRWHMSSQAMISPKNKNLCSPLLPSSITGSEGCPSPFFLHASMCSCPCCFQAHCSSCEPFSLHLLCPHLQKLPLNSPHLFQKSKVLKESLLGLQSPGTFYLGQEARGNHVILADKAIMRPGYGSKGMKCS